MIAPPIPWKARAKIRNVALGDRAHSNDANENRPSPIANIRRRPSRSASVPAVNRSEASVSA